MKKYIISACLTFCCATLYAIEGDVYDHYMRGDINILNGDLDSAIKEYKKASELSPKDTYIKVKLAYAYLQSIDEKKAIEILQEAIKTDYKNVEALLLYAEISMSEKKYDKALKLCEKILKVEPYNKDAVNYTAAMLIESGNPAEATQLLKKYLQKNTEDDFPYYYLGVIYETAGDITTAEEYYKKTLKINPDYQPALVALFSIYSDLKTKTGILKMEQLAELSPQNSEEIKEKLVWLCVVAGDKDKAVKYMDELSAGSDSDIYYQIQKALLLGDIGRKEEAIKTLDKLLILYPENELANYHKALFQDEIGEKDKALKTMEKVIQINKTNKNSNPYALNYVGYMYAELNMNMGKAKEYIEEALELKPDDPYILDSAGWLYFKIGRSAETKEQEEKAFETAKKYGEMAFDVMSKSSKYKYEREIVDHLIQIYEAKK
ncbi:MAG: tetratricopeptide repeat protein, partial [Pseudomonadota bacterium]